MEKIRYKYKEVKKGFCLKDVKCPVCGSNHINWQESVNTFDYNSKVILLAECWSGDIVYEKPKHLFLIELENLPVVKVNKIKK